MKTRIISGAVMAAVVAAVIASGRYYPVIITVFIGAVCAVAAYEMTHTAGGVEKKSAVSGACIYSFAVILCYSGIMPSFITPQLLSVIYVIYIAILSLRFHSELGLREIALLAGMPLIISYAFYTLEGTLNHNDGIYYLLLLLNFSSICDIGAYFIGSLFGKHKLCPKISPKKTVEGAVGGIALSLVGTLVIALCFKHTQSLYITLPLTIPLCFLGMAGDLFASVIKRSAGIKDYGKLIPGHGGVLDRVDSILMLSPALFFLITSGVI